MPGVSRTPPTTSPTTTPNATTSSSTATGGAQLALQQAPGGGNAAAVDACGEEESWEEMGNLIGNPPVRDRCNPPNKGIVENEAVYQGRRDAARETLVAQKQRADSYLDADGEVIDHRYWFAKVYSFVTEEELGTTQAAAYYYPSYVMECVRYFDQIYVDNANAWDNGGEVEEHWRQAFQTAMDSSGTMPEDVIADGGGTVVGGLLGGIPGAVLGYFAGDAMSEVYTAVSNLVVSMKAHIRFDLPRAEAWVFNQNYSGMENANIRNFQPDFQSMAPVFDRAGERMNDEIADKTGVPVTLMPRMLQDLSMDWYFDADMVTERADTWDRAEELVNSGVAGDGPYRDQGGHLSGDVTSGDNMSLLDTLPEDLRPNMDDSAEGYDDDDVRDITGRESEQTLAQRSASDRTRMLRGLINGYTGDADESSIIDILEASRVAGDVVTVIDGANAWELADNVHGSEWTEVHRFFRTYYYPRTGQLTAFTLITRCLDGYTSEWQEEMVADVLLDRTDGRTLIEMIGHHYDGGGFSEGLNKLEWQLDGVDESRVADQFGTSGSFW